MDVCAYDSRGCISFAEALDTFEHPELAGSMYIQWSQLNSAESQWWAEQKLIDIQNQEKIAMICLELGRRAASECAVHSKLFTVDIKPRTPQIYRANQPQEALHSYRHRPNIDETLKTTTDDIYQGQPPLYTTTPSQPFTARELEHAA